MVVYQPCALFQTRYWASKPGHPCCQFSSAQAFLQVTVFIVYQVRYLAFNMRAILLPNQRTAPENLSPGWTRHKSSDTPDSKASCKYLVEIDSLWSIYSIWFNIKQYLKGFNDNFQKRRLFQSFRFWASEENILENIEGTLANCENPA